jgi:hypothetical protein
MDTLLRRNPAETEAENGRRPGRSENEKLKGELAEARKN